MKALILLIVAAILVAVFQPAPDRRTKGLASLPPMPDDDQEADAPFFVIFAANTRPYLDGKGKIRTTGQSGYYEGGRPENPRLGADEYKARRMQPGESLEVVRRLQAAGWRTGRKLIG